jgi:hypothetical protein
MLPLFHHELTTGHMCVAEDAGRLVGFAALLVRNDVGFLAELFVMPDLQSHGIGRLLLQRALATPATTYCTMSSRDPRALALYARAGLQPMWPHFLLKSTSPALAPLSGEDITITVAELADPNLITWDARIAGRVRREDHAYWGRALAAVPLWCVRAGVTVGYGYVWRRAVGSTGGAQVGLGPLGAEKRTDVIACVGAVLRWLTREKSVGGDDTQIEGTTYYVAVPGPHPVLVPLLEAGFQIADVETFCCSCPTLFFDPQIYIGPAGPEGTSVF